MTLFIVAAPTHGATTPRAANGLLDLSNWNFTGNGIVPLDGEWEFYWSRLVHPDEFAGSEAPAPDGLIAVPGNWSGFTPIRQGASIERHGYATYRLTVKLPANGGDREPLAIFIPLVSTSYRLWANDQLIAENGRVGTSLSSTTPQARPLTAQFHAEEDVVHLVLQVANFHFREGGVHGSLELGLADHVHLVQRRKEWIDTFLTGLAVFTVLLYLALYAHRFENRAALYFALFVLALTVRMAFLGNAMAYRLFPAISWEVGRKLEYLPGYWSAPLFFLYLRSIFPQETSRFMVRTPIVISTIASLIVLFTPGRISSLLIPPYLYVLLTYILYGLYVATLAVKRKREDARIIMAGVAIFLISVFASLLDYADFVPMLEAIPIGIAALVVTQGWTLARRFNQHVRLQERLLAENAEMLKQTRFQLAEVQKYRRLMTEREEGLRSQIAEMLHGRTQGRLLTALRNIQLALENLRHNPGQAEERLADAEDLLHRVRKEDIREVGKRLHPSAVRAGLIPAMQTLLDPIEDAYQVAFEVDPAVEALDSPDDLQISYDLRLGIYRILEEALNNIARHAKATSVRVTVSLIPNPGGDHLELTIEDDGQGCDPAALTHGLGLHTIDARVGDLGGTWRFESSPGEGASLCAQFPLSRPVAAEEGSLLKNQSLPEGASGLDQDQNPASPGEARTPDFRKSG